MPVFPTGLGNTAIVPCSHCNVNDQGPEAGICHRNMVQNNTIDDQPCSKCSDAKFGPSGLFGGIIRGIVVGVSGQSRQVQCCYCNGKGYVKI